MLRRGTAARGWLEVSMSQSLCTTTLWLTLLLFQLLRWSLGQGWGNVDKGTAWEWSAVGPGG